MQIRRVEVNNHLKKMVTLDDDMLVLKNYLRWNICGLEHAFFFKKIRTYLTHLQTEFHIPSLTP
jgi:hypothetical protein